MKALPLMFASLALFRAETEAVAAQVRLGNEVVLLPEGPGKGLQDTPHAAFGQGSYLVVWREGADIEGGRARIHAARVSTAGKVLDPKSIAVAPNKTVDASQTNPRVAFCPSGGAGVFLVVWQDFRNGLDLDILAARISGDGQVLDSEPIRVAASPATQAMPDVASNGQGFIVVYQAHPDKPGPDAYRTLATPVTADGKAGAPIEVLDQPHPKVAWDGASYLVVAGGVHSVHPGFIRARLLGPDGRPKANAFTITAGGGAPMLAISAQPGKGWHLTTCRNYPDFWGWGGPPAQKGYFVTSEGKLAADLPKERDYPKYGVLEPGWLDVAEGDFCPYGTSGSAWDGKHCVVVWQRFHKPPPVGFSIRLVNADLMLARVEGWKSIDGRGHPVANGPEEERTPALASDGAGKLLCAYTKKGADGRVLVVARTLEPK